LDHYQHQILKSSLFKSFVNERFVLLRSDFSVNIKLQLSFKLCNKIFTEFTCFYGASWKPKNIKKSNEKL